MWNAPGHYQAVGFQPRRVSRVVADRARRFANLVEAADKFRFGMPARSAQAALDALNMKTVAVVKNTEQVKTSIE
jgi:hypothetical protein